MLKTTNYDLNKIELTDSPPDIAVINPNWDTIDTEMKSLRGKTDSLVANYVRSPGYGVATGSANVYAVTLNPALPAYVAGVCVAIKIPVANTGASTINIDGLGAKPIKDSKGSDVTAGKLALNGVYTLRYDDETTNFILQGEGGEYGTATASEVLAGKTIGTDNGIVTGTMPSKGAATITPSTVAQIISAGQYLSGTQTIEGDADLLAANIVKNKNIFGVVGTALIPTGDAIATDVLNNKVFSNASGVNKVGAMPNQGSVGTQNLTTEGQEYTIASGYHNGLGKVKAVITGLIESVIKAGVTVGGKVGTFTADATATAADILFGKSAYVNGNKITGSMVDIGTVNQTLTTQDQQFLISAGKHSGSGKVTANISNLIADNIKSGVNVGGVVGSFSKLSDVLASALVGLSNDYGKISTSAVTSIPSGTSAVVNSTFIQVLYNSYGGSYNSSISSASEFLLKSYNSTPVKVTSYGPINMSPYGLLIYNPDKNNITIQSISGSINVYKIID